MRILLGAIHSPVTAARSLYWALRDMGHEVLSIGPFSNVMDWAGSDPLNCYEWTPDIGYANPAIPYPYWLPWTPDLMIQTDVVMDKMPGVPNVLYAIDNHAGAYNGGAGFDRIFVGHSWGHLADLPNAKWLPAGHDPRYHKQTNRGERPIDVLFMGTMYPHRRELIDYLNANGVTVTVLPGEAWPEYNRLYNQAKIALVCSKSGDLAGRVFEHMAAGCLVVMDRVADADKIGLVDGVHYLACEQTRDFIGRLRYAIYNPHRAAEMAQHGHEWVQPHTWDARAQVLCESC